MEDSKGKFCGSCGANMPETAQFCPKCGTKVPEMPGQPVVQNDAAAQAAAPTEAPAGAAPVAPTATPATASTAAQAEAPAGAPPVPPTMPSATPYATPMAGQTGTTSSFGGAGFAGFSAQPQTMQQTALGMNWYKFLIYFLLFFDALILVIEAIVLFTGSHYGGYASLVYLFFGGLRAFDIIFGLASLALAVMAIYVRQKLAQFKRDAPRLLCALIIANGVVGLIYLWGAAALSSSFTVSVVFTAIGIIGGCAIWTAANYVYFNKRAHLFVN